MRKVLNIAAAVFALAALAGVTLFSFANAGEEEDMMIGVIVAERNAALEVEDQTAETGYLTVARVLAPSDSWIAVHMDEDGMPGPRVGLARVEKGVSTDVRVELDDEAELLPTLIVALHADRGVANKIEFDPKRFEQSPDKPYFVDGEELAKVVAVR